MDAHHSYVSCQNLLILQMLVRLETKKLLFAFQAPTYQQAPQEHHTANPFPVTITGISLRSNSTL